MGRRDGFTLPELLVAVTLAGLAVSLAMGVFTTSSDAVRAVRQDAVEWDRQQNARSWLRQAFASVEASVSSGARFRGRPDGAEFRAWLWTADGWLEPADVELRLEGEALVAAVAGAPIQLFDSLSAFHIDYLGRLGADSPWTSKWSSEVSPPYAVRLRLMRLQTGESVDTLLFWIGERG